MLFLNYHDAFHRGPTARVWNLVLFTIPLLLFLPALYYSLTTPFALVDDYGMCYFVEFLDNGNKFWNWFHRQVLDFSYGRYRPFFDLYNMASWKLFGATPWPHHLTRWLMHFVSIGLFSASFIVITRDKTNNDLLMTGERLTRSIFVPLALLIYVWMFFPNVPAARLGPQEVYTVFFLGVCNFMLALIIVRGRKEARNITTAVHYGFLYIGFLGLSVSKEINIAVMLWIVVFYVGLLLRGWDWKRLLAGMPLLLIFFYTLKKILIASSNNYYGVEPVTLDLLIDNLAWIYKGLFQVHTSPIIAAAFIVLTLSLLCKTALQLIKGQTDNELIYIVLIVGQFISLYLILSTSWAKVLRYWYVIIPVFTTLIAFSARSTLEFTRKNHPVLNRGSVLFLIVFLVYFIGCNYYNFLLQVVAQHSLRQAEAELIIEVSELHDQDNYIYILLDKNESDVELLHHLVAFYRNFSPRFHEKKYIIHTSPPKQSGQPYYLVTRRKQADNWPIHRHITPRHDYLILNYTHRLSGLFQQKKPFETKDAGVHRISRYDWYIYRNST